MQFVHVTNPPRNKEISQDLEAVIANYTRTCLISLFPGMSSINFGFDTIYKTGIDISKYKKTFLSDSGGELYIDSGGYSFIQGLIPPSDAQLMIDTYHAFLYNFKNKYDYIFSLDLPFNANYPSFNTKNNVYEFNKRSLIASSRILHENEELQKKFYFIWQFKFCSQYEIWKKIYEELEINNLILNRAIGGMVGLRGRTKIKFSPFIAMAYRCFWDYLEGPQGDFRLHFLGIYTVSDRFVISFLENLFLQYFNYEKKVVFSYDTIKNMREGIYNDNLNFIHCFTNGKLYRYFGPETIPDEILNKIYYKDRYFTWIKGEITKLKTTDKKSIATAFVPLSIMNHMAVNKIIEDSIFKLNLVNLIDKCKSDSNVEHIFRNPLDKLKKVFQLFLLPGYAQISWKA